MDNSIFALTAAEILKIAFDEFIKSSVRETSKKLTGDAFIKAGKLRQKIVERFRKNQNSEANNDIVAIQEHGSLEALKRLSSYLDVEMNAEPDFARSLQSLAQQTSKICQNPKNWNQQNNNYGRNQNIINNLQGNIQIGGN